VVIFSINFLRIKIDYEQQKTTMIGHRLTKKWEMALKACNNLGIEVVGRLQTEVYKKRDG